MTDPLNIYLVILCAVAATYIWRLAGVLLAKKIDPEGEVFIWLGCVAYALLAGLMARVMIYPVGMLAESSLLDRLLAMAAGFALFILLKRNFMAATMVSTVCFYLLFRFTP